VAGQASEEEVVLQQRCQVLVVGAGPVGSSTTMFLSRQGVQVAVVDKRDPSNAPPRASTSVRTLELFRSVGLGDACDGMAWNVPAPLRSVIKSSAVGGVVHLADPPPRYAQWLQTCSPVGIDRGLTQLEVQQLASDKARRCGARVQYGIQVVGIEVEETGVRATVVDAASGAEHMIECDYLIGADGAGSQVRQMVGIDVPSPEVAARMNTAFFRADLRRLLPESATRSVFIRNEEVYCTLFAKGAHGDRWSAHIMDYPGKPTPLSPLSAEQTIRLLHSAIGDQSVAIDLIECNAWEATFAVASAFRNGRVFLAGDAAHTQSSAGGLGMNTGIADGHNLAWKLAAVLRGHAGPDLLDSYEPERRSAVKDSLAVSHQLHDGYQAQGDTRQLYERIAEDYLRGMMCYRYTSGAVMAGEKPTPHPLANKAVTGCRLPHRWLDEGGTTKSTLDLIGPRWTLLVGPNGQQWSDSAGGAGLELDIRQITDGNGHHNAATFLEMAEISPDGALLVRPDQFIAWHSPELPTAPGPAIRHVMSTLLGHRVE
jgi:tetracenomycin A2 monooxygenase-dioxygenase